MEATHVNSLIIPTKQQKNLNKIHYQNQDPETSQQTSGIDEDLDFCIWDEEDIQETYTTTLKRKLLLR